MLVKVWLEAGNSAGTGTGTGAGTGTVLGTVLASQAAVFWRLGIEPAATKGSRLKNPQI